MKKKVYMNLIGVIISLFFTGYANAQNLAIKGKVISASSKEALPGVSVVIKGTTLGAFTNADGEFSLSVPDANSILVFSFVGMVSQEITVGQQIMINVELVENVTQLNELVVIGYGTQRKGDVTSSIASVKQESFLKGGVRDIGQLIQGKVAGLTISSVSGDPTSNTEVRLRGSSTINGTSTNPLILVDGVPGDFNSVAPEDVESIDVLKDGSSAAIYGTRGTNGVIIITSKRVSGGYKNTVDYSGYTSTQTVTNRLKMSTAADVRNQIAAGYRDASDDIGYSTDWFKQITRTPISQSHDLTFRGGDSKTNYLGTINYKALQGIFLKSDDAITNIRAEINHSMFNDMVKINLGASTRFVKYDCTGDGYSFNGYTYRQANIYNPTAPVKNADGSWYEVTGAFNYDNPLARIKECDGKFTTQYTRANGVVAFEPIKGLIFRSLIAYSKYNETRAYSETKNHISTKRSGYNGYATLGSIDSTTRNLDLTGEYSTTLDKHRFSVLGGYSYLEGAKLSYWMQNCDFPTDAFGYSNIQLGTGLKSGSSLVNIWSGRYANNLIAFFGRATYAFDDKYLFMGSLRREAASQLAGTKNPWGTFPAFSLGWRISKESFMQNYTFVDDIKIRGGYGVTGSQPNQAYLGSATMSYSGYFYSDGTWKNTLSPARNLNPYLRWEEKKETNIGFDFSLLRSRISGTFDYYNRKIDGLLYDFTVPVPPNAVSTTMANVGVMENKGIEVLLNIVPVRTTDFEWTTSVSFSTNKNKLVSLSNDLYTNTSNYFTAGSTGEPIQTYTHRVDIGGPIGNFYGYKVVDVEADGKWIYLNKSGERVSSDKFSYNDTDKMVLGNGVPKFNLSWGNTFKYKNFDLSISMRGAFKFQILNFDRMYLENTKTTAYNRLKSAYDKVYGKAVLSTDEDLEFNSYYIENGNYWKIDNVTLGYNFNFKANKYINSARIYVATLNTLCITGYKGTDPEVSTNGLTPGNDYRDKYPTTRTYTIGINVKF
jgi:TonB-dependent starch-binding outer membrane protein SusC